MGEARSVGVAPPSGIVWRGGVWLGDDELPLHGARTLHRCDAGSGALRPVAGYADGSAGFVG